MIKFLMGLGTGVVVTTGLFYANTKGYQKLLETKDLRLEMWRDAVVELAVDAKPEDVIRIAERLQFDSLLISNDLNPHKKEQ